jgi:DNA-binding CsgD family transcriptional regulator
VDQDAEPHYLAALDLHQPSLEQARTQLLYRSWLRRTRRKSQAGTQLRAAAGYPERAAARYWAQRARAELATLAVAAPAPGPPSTPRLTPQELQVARLAAHGRSNREIAALLFLSPRTVGHHLYKACPKLGITSRSELDLDTLSRRAGSPGSCRSGRPRGGPARQAESANSPPLTRLCVTAPNHETQARDALAERWARRSAANWRHRPRPAPVTRGPGGFWRGYLS